MQVQTQNEIHYYYNHISIQVLYKGSNLKWIESKLIEETKGVAFNGQRYEPETMGSSSLRKAGMIISRGGGVAKVVETTHMKSASYIGTIYDNTIIHFLRFKLQVVYTLCLLGDLH